MSSLSRQQQRHSLLPPIRYLLFAATPAGLLILGTTPSCRVMVIPSGSVWRCSYRRVGAGAAFCVRDGGCPPGSSRTSGSFSATLGEEPEVELALV